MTTNNFKFSVKLKEEIKTKKNTQTFHCYGKCTLTINLVMGEIKSLDFYTDCMKEQQNAKQRNHKFFYYKI